MLWQWICSVVASIARLNKNVEVLDDLNLPNVVALSDDGGHQLHWGEIGNHKS